MSDHASVLDTYFRVSAELNDPNVAAHRRRIRLLFDGIDLRGKSFLDVGGGSGLMSYYAAAAGSTRVVCLEPNDAGSNPRMSQVFNTWGDRLGLYHQARVDLVHQSFQDLALAGTEPFDVILVHNAINHLDEEACARLPADPVAKKTYETIFKSLASLTASGGVLILADAARHNAWNALGLRSPFAPTINWSIHAQPKVWSTLAGNAGYVHRALRWRAHSRLGPIGQFALGNKVGGWLTNSNFILQLQKP